jgi:hypothetical protein
MKPLPMTFLVCSALITAAHAQNPVPNAPVIDKEHHNPNFSEPPQHSISTGTSRDGFFLSNSSVYMVRNGVTTLVEREIDFPNGLRVMPSGKVTLRDGREVDLLRNQWLNFEGTLEDYAALPPPAPPTDSKASRESGISNRDGITISGADVFITRNGITDKVIADVRLPNGVIAKPNGTIVLGNGKSVTLRFDQVLGLDGQLREAPVPPPPAGSVVTPSSNQHR